MLVEIASALLFFISFYGLISSKNIIRSIIAIGLMEMSVVVFFLGLGFTNGSTPPIGQNMENVADPLPQALVITAIIIGLAVTAVNLTMFISLCRKYKTSDWDEVKRANTSS